jgi:hypothetical protein
MRDKVDIDLENRENTDDLNLVLHKELAEESEAFLDRASEGDISLRLALDEIGGMFSDEGWFLTNLDLFKIVEDYFKKIIKNKEGCTK